MIWRRLSYLLPWKRRAAERDMQEELQSIRALAGSCCFLDRRWHLRDRFWYVGFFPGHARLPKGQAANHCASIRPAKQSDNSGVIEDADQRSGALRSI